ncbi:hypothetical protein, partial [Desulfosarcina sp.]|uniref:hypothetical protein n=1 Tax=Desulfosarcina sp. TaxID=2027861 RepID=UPI0029A1CD17
MKPYTLLDQADAAAVGDGFNQKNSSELCYGVKNKEGVGVEGETTCPLPMQNRFSNPFDTSQLCCGEVH